MVPVTPTESLGLAKLAVTMLLIVKKKYYLFNDEDEKLHITSQAQLTSGQLSFKLHIHKAAMC